MNFGDLIFVKRNTLTKEFCSTLIDKFNSSDCKYTGRIGGGIDTTVKRSTDLNVSSCENRESFLYEDDILSKCLNDATKEYIGYLNAILLDNFFVRELEDTGYQVQRTEPNGFYKWHSDDMVEAVSKTDDKITLRKRIFTFIWYLNDVKNNGYTEFIDGTKIQPEAGKLVLFPATNYFVHRGFPPKDEVKYICTGWLHETNSFIYNENNL